MPITRARISALSLTGVLVLGGVACSDDADGNNVNDDLEEDVNDLSGDISEGVNDASDEIEDQIDEGAEDEDRGDTDQSDDMGGG
jgi:hypothetical protein